MRTSFGDALKQLEKAVRQRVRLDTPNKQGVTLRQSLLHTKKQYQKRRMSSAMLDAELQPVPLKPGTESVLSTFWTLNSTRQEGMSGPQPISYTELKAYCELMDEHLSPWEVSAIKLMDAAFLDEGQKLFEKGQ